MNNITTDFLQDVQGFQVMYACKFFYLWLFIKYGDKEFEFRDVVKWHPRSKRQVQRYFRDLKSIEMVEVTQRASRHKPKKFRLCEFI